MVRHSRVFYAWVIVGITIVSMTLVYGIRHSFSVFFPSILDEFGWSRGSTALMLSLNLLVYGVIAPLAGSLVVILLPLYLLFFHYRPENRGLQPYGAEGLPATKTPIPLMATAENATAHYWTPGQAMRTYQLWLLMLSYFLFWGIGTYLVLTHQVKFAEDVGYSSTFAASIFALFGILQVAGQLCAGISDWMGRELTITLTVILTIGALVALVSVQDTSQPWLLYLYAICFGYGVGFFTPTMTAGAADLFHGKHFGAIAGMLLTGMGLGGAIGPWLGGYLYDTSGSYVSAFVLSMVCFALACAAFWMAAPRHAARLRAKADKIPV